MGFCGGTRPLLLFDMVPYCLFIHHLKICLLAIIHPLVKINPVLHSKL